MWLLSHVFFTPAAMQEVYLVLAKVFSEFRDSLPPLEPPKSLPVLIPSHFPPKRVSGCKGVTPISLECIFLLVYVPIMGGSSSQDQTR